MSLLSDPELKLTFSVLPSINCLNCSVVIFVFLCPVSAVLLDEWVFCDVLSMFCKTVTVTMFFATMFLLFVTI